MATKNASANKYGAKSSENVEREMKAMKAGKLKSGSGQTVTNPKQAIAIALSETRKAGGKVPPAKKAAAKKTAAKMSGATKSSTASKAATKKPTAKKAAAKKAAAKKSSAKKSSSKSAAKKSAR